MVVHVVREALSRDPGVICGVSPTESEADFLAFFSRYFFDKVLYFSPCGRKLRKGGLGGTLAFVSIHVR